MIYRKYKKLLDGELKEDKCIDSGVGCPSKQSRLYHRYFKKTLPMLREIACSLTSNRAQVVNRIEHVSNRKVRRAMNIAGYKYCGKNESSPRVIFRKNLGKIYAKYIL